MWLPDHKGSESEYIGRKVNKRQRASRKGYPLPFSFWEVIFIKSNVLIIDTDLENCKQIKYNLLSMDIEVYYTQSVSEAIEKMQGKQYSLVIMDVLLSTMEGIEMLSIVKQIHDRPLFILSEQASATERVLALKSGADDVLTKPFDLEECLARAHTLLRQETERHPTAGRKYVVVGQEDLLLDTASRMVSLNGIEIRLTRKEYEILLYMLTHRKQVLSYEQIYNAVWKDGFLGDNSVVFFQVNQLRKKLGEDWIENVYGIGYRMRDFVSN